MSTIIFSLHFFFFCYFLKVDSLNFTLFFSFDGDLLVLGESPSEKDEALGSYFFSTPLSFGGCSASKSAVLSWFPEKSKSVSFL